MTQGEQLTMNACAKHTTSLLLVKNYLLAPKYLDVLKDRFTRILVPRIYIEIYSAYDRLSATVGKNSSGREQGLHPNKTERIT